MNGQLTGMGSLDGWENNWFLMVKLRKVNDTSQHLLDIYNNVSDFAPCLQSQEGSNELDWVQGKATKVVGGWSTTSVRRNWGSRACRGWLRGFLIRAASRASKKVIKELEPVSSQWRVTGGQGTMGIRWNKRFRVDVSPMKKVKCGNSFPREVVQSPSLSFWRPNWIKPWVF